MSLKTQLSDFMESFRANVTGDTLAIVDEATEDLANTDIVDRSPKVGDTLLNFSLPNQSGELRELKTLLEKGPLVVTFYRGGWCPYCNLELKAYQEMLEEITAEGAALIAITPELPDASLTTTEKNALKFEILSDADSHYARELGIVFSLPTELRPVYEGFGIDVEKHNGTGQFDLPLPATYVVAQDGTVVSAYANADYTQRQEPAEMLEKLKAITATIEA